jgi:hypothetical protein
MKNTIRVIAIVAAVAGFLMVSTPASAYPYRYHRHYARSVYVGGRYYRPYYRPYYAGYGYYPYYAGYYAPYYYGRPYYHRPVVSIGIGF